MKKTLLLGLITIALTISIAIGFSYALWTQTEKQEGENVVQAGCFQLSFTAGENDINFTNAYPISDEKGIELKAYTFTIKNTCSIYAHYSVNLEKLNVSTMSDEYVKLQLNNRRPILYSAYNKVTPTGTGIESRSLDFGGLEPQAERSYTLKLWIDGEATNEQVEEKTFQGNIVVDSVAAEPTGAEYIENLLANNKETMNNDDPDENVRYMGATPNNYVRFNDELWRIIGVFYVKSSANGDYEKRLKIINNESIGNYAWDTSDMSVNNGWGVNEWSQADLKTLLNDTYYYSQSSETCYTGQNNAHISCDFSGNSESSIRGLNENARSMIYDVVWNTGTVEQTWDVNPVKYMSKDFYVAERSNNPGKKCSNDVRCTDEVERKTIWIGKIGLMYPSDYVYATSGNGESDRQVCITKNPPNSWSSYASCYSNDWLFNNVSQWLLTPVPQHNLAYYVTYLNKVGFVGHATTGFIDYDDNSQLATRPVVYLKSEVKITADEEHAGSESKPYELSL